MTLSNLLDVLIVHQSSPGGCKVPMETGTRFRPTKRRLLPTVLQIAYTRRVLVDI